MIRFAPAAAVLVVFAAGSAIVLADGGDSSQIHGCLERSEADPNLIVVDAGDSCPSETSPIHWPGLASKLPPSAASSGSEAVLDAAAPSGKVSKKLYKPQGIKLGNTETVSEVYSDTTNTSLADVWTEVEGGASCPGSHPYRVSGGHTLPATPATGQLSNLDGFPVGEHGWYASVLWFGGGKGQTLTLEVSVTCAKVKTPPQVQAK